MSNLFTVPSQRHLWPCGCVWETKTGGVVERCRTHVASRDRHVRELLALAEFVDLPHEALKYLEEK